jgi:hypothetical protein
VEVELLSRSGLRLAVAINACILVDPAQQLASCPGRHPDEMHLHRQNLLQLCSLALKPGTTFLVTVSEAVADTNDAPHALSARLERRLE